MGVLTFDLAFFLLATSAAAWRAVGLFGKNMQERVCKYLHEVCKKREPWQVVQATAARRPARLFVPNANVSIRGMRFRQRGGR